MAASEQLLEQMFSWLQQRESCAQQLREAASRIELSVTTSAAAASAQSLLPSDIMNDTHNVDRKREEISDTIQQLFEQLKTAMMEKAVGSVFARPEQMEHWKDLVERNHLSEASQSLKETADNITKTSRTLKGQFHHVRRMLEEMTVNSEHTRSRIEQESPDHLLGAEQLTARKRSSRDKVRNKQDEEEQTEDEGAERTKAGVSLRVALLNVRSMEKKTSQVKKLISQNHLDVFCTTESWLKGDSAENVLREASPLTFNCCYSVRPGRGGGVVIQLSQELQAKQTHFSCATGTFEFVAADVKHGEWDEPVLIMTLYRPPKPNMTQFLKEFEKLLNQVCEKYNSIVITGDFNVWADDQSRGKRFKRFLHEYKLVQHVREPTHSKGHTVDLVITREVKIYGCFVRDDGISDHYTVYFKMRPVSVDTKKTREESGDEDALINTLGEVFRELKMTE